MDNRILIPLLVLGIAYVIFCLHDLIKISKVKYLPKWLWGIICFISIPLGGIIYFIVGRDSNG